MFRQPASTKIKVRIRIMRVVPTIPKALLMLLLIQTPTQIQRARRKREIMTKAKNDLDQGTKGKVEKTEKDLQAEGKNGKKVKKGSLKKKEAKAETKRGIDQRTNLIKEKKTIGTKKKIRRDKKIRREKTNPKSKPKTNDTIQSIN